MKSNRIDPLPVSFGDDVPSTEYGYTNEAASVPAAAARRQTPIAGQRFKNKARKIASVKGITQANIVSSYWQEKATRFVRRRSRSKRFKQQRQFNVYNNTTNEGKYTQATFSGIEDDEEINDAEEVTIYEDGASKQQSSLRKNASVNLPSKALVHYFAKVWLM